MTIRLNFLIACLCVAFGTRIFAAETNSTAGTNAVPPPPQPSDMTAQNVVNGYLQIQQQLHETELNLEKGREEAAVSAQRNADAIQYLEQKITAQHDSEVAAVQGARQLTLTLAGAFGAAGLAAVLLLVYFQWRTVTRFMAFSTPRPAGFSMGNGGDAPSLVTGAAVGESNARLLGAVDHLQKRILELEQTVRGTLAEKNPPAANGKSAAPKNGSSTTDDREECVANLITEGQALLDAGNAEKALDCFDVALGLDAKHIEALVKKGGALEKLGRTDEAIACYDRAIEADNAATIAYLQKGGLFNRLARYDEALKCYEMALQTQEKIPAAKS